MQREIVKRKRNITTNLIASWCSLVPPEYFAQILIFEMTNVLLWKLVSTTKNKLLRK